MKVMASVTGSLGMSNDAAFCFISSTAHRWDICDAYRTIRDELVAYGGGLEAKTEIVALNKCDALDDETVAARKAALAAVDGVEDVLTISGAAGTDVQDALRRLNAVIAEERADAEPSVEGMGRPWNMRPSGR